MLVGDRPLDDEEERREPPVGGPAERLEELVAVGVGQDGVVEADARQAGDGAEQNVLDGSAGGGGHGDGVAVAAEARGDPEDVDFRDGRLRRADARRRRVRCHGFLRDGEGDCRI